MQVEHLDAVPLHLLHEVEVVLDGLIHPDHVVEQQIMAVAWGQALMREAGPADHHGLELAHFRMCAELPLHGHSDELVRTKIERQAAMPPVMSR